MSTPLSSAPPSPWSSFTPQPNMYTSPPSSPGCSWTLGSESEPEPESDPDPNADADTLMALPPKPKPQSKSQPQPQSQPQSQPQPQHQLQSQLAATTATTTTSSGSQTRQAKFLARAGPLRPRTHTTTTTSSAARTTSSSTATETAALGTALPTPWTATQHFSSGFSPTTPTWLRLPVPPPSHSPTATSFMTPPTPRSLALARVMKLSPPATPFLLAATGAVASDEPGRRGSLPVAGALRAVAHAAALRRAEPGMPAVGSLAHGRWLVDGRSSGCDCGAERGSAGRGGRSFIPSNEADDALQAKRNEVYTVHDAAAAVQQGVTATTTTKESANRGNAATILANVLAGRSAGNSEQHGVVNAARKAHVFYELVRRYGLSRVEAYRESCQRRVMSPWEGIERAAARRLLAQAAAEGKAKVNTHSNDSSGGGKGEAWSEETEDALCAYPDLLPLEDVTLADLEAIVPIRPPHPNFPPSRRAQALKAARLAAQLEAAAASAAAGLGATSVPGVAKLLARSRFVPVRKKKTKKNQEKQEEEEEDKINQQAVELEATAYGSACPVPYGAMRRLRPQPPSQRRIAAPLTKGRSGTTINPSTNDDEKQDGEDVENNNNNNNNNNGAKDRAERPQAALFDSTVTIPGRGWPRPETRFYSVVGNPYAPGNPLARKCSYQPRYFSEGLRDGVPDTEEQGQGQGQGQEQEEKAAIQPIMHLGVC